MRETCPKSSFSGFCETNLFESILWHYSNTFDTRNTKLVMDQLSDDITEIIFYSIQRSEVFLLVLRFRFELNNVDNGMVLKINKSELTIKT